MKRQVIRKIFVLMAGIALFTTAGNAIPPNYSLVLAPGEWRDWYVSCIDYWGYTIPYADVTMVGHYVSNSNAHYHPTTGTHPTASYTPSSGNTGATGEITVRFAASMIGQDEYARVTCSVPGYTPLTTNNFYSVALTDLYWTGAHTDVWELVGATEYHGSVHENRYMMTQPAYRLYETTVEYLTQYPDTPGGKVAANDQSLPFGGVFDIGRTWAPPHQFHTWGTAADIRGNMGDYRVPVSRQQDFVQACENNGAILAQIENANPGDTDQYVQDINRHIHCHWDPTQQ